MEEKRAVTPSQVVSYVSSISITSCSPHMSAFLKKCDFLQETHMSMYYCNRNSCKNSGQDVRRTFFLVESMIVAKIAILVPARYHSTGVRHTYEGNP
jgi:hypothetical protein